MKINRFQAHLIAYVFLIPLSLSQSAEAMLAKHAVIEGMNALNRSMRHVLIEPIISRSFSRYAKFDGEKQDNYIARAQTLRELDNEAWRKTLELRSEYNSDWEALQEKYFPKPKVTDNSHESSNRSISYSGGGGSSDTPDTNGFLKGWFARDVTDFIFDSKPKTDTGASHGSSVSTTSSSSSSSHTRGNSNSNDSGGWSSSGGDSDSWSSGGGSDSGGSGGSGGGGGYDD